MGCKPLHFLGKGGSTNALFPPLLLTKRHSVDNNKVKFNNHD